jgi:putative peptidoglycan lipid II flippase
LRVIARSDHESQLVRALGSIGTATLASRVLGFVRDMVVARAFGAGPVTDAFFVAFRIPNILRRLLGEGALSTAVVPMLTDYLVTRPRTDFNRLFRAMLGAALVVLGVVTAIGVAAAPWVVRAMAPGFAGEPGQLALTIMLTRLMFPYLILVGLAALVMGALNAHGRFFTAALGPAAVNVGMIACVLALAPHVRPPIVSLGVGVLVGGLGQLVMQLPELRLAGVPLQPSRELRHPALGRLVRLLLPSVFGLATVQVTVFINTLLASLLPSGSISYLYYADRVMEFPLGVFGIALASAALPAMSRQAAAGDTHALARTLNFALRLSCYTAIPATVGLVMLRVPITRVLFERGRFGPTETAATAWALAWYALGLAAFSGTRIAAQAFYAMGDTRTPVLTGLASVAVNVAVAVALLRPMEHAGLAFASSASAYANLVLLVWLARRRMGSLGAREVARSVARTALAALGLGLWCAALLWAWPPGARLLVEAAWLAAAIAGGGLVFWLTSGALRSPERASLFRSLPSSGAG